MTKRAGADQTSEARPRDMERSKGVVFSRSIKDTRHLGLAGLKLIQIQKWDDLIASGANNSHGPNKEAECFDLVLGP